MNKKYANKLQVIQDIHRAAQIYKTQLTNRVFLYVFDHRYIEVRFGIIHFRHLTGVSTTISAKEFFRNAVNNRLQASQISFTSSHPYALCQRKLKHICDIATLMTSECLILEDIGTATRTFRFGATDLNCTVCLDVPVNAQGIPADHVYVAESLRDEDCLAKSQGAYEVSYIFSRSDTAREYDTLHFRDERAIVDDLPSAVVGMLTQELMDSIAATESTETP